MRPPPNTAPERPDCIRIVAADGHGSTLDRWASPRLACPEGQNDDVQRRTT